MRCILWNPQIRSLYRKKNPQFAHFLRPNLSIREKPVHRMQLAIIVLSSKNKSFPWNPLVWSGTPCFSILEIRYLKSILTSGNSQSLKLRDASRDCRLTVLLSGTVHRDCKSFTFVLYCIFFSSGQCFQLQVLDITRECGHQRIEKSNFLLDGQHWFPQHYWAFSCHVSSMFISYFNEIFYAYVQQFVFID